jgi:hypothetical protein
LIRGNFRTPAKLVRACGQAAVGPADPREMIERYAAAKIVLNNSAHHDLNMRYFEPMGSAAVLLTARRLVAALKSYSSPGATSSNTGTRRTWSASLPLC